MIIYIINPKNLLKTIIINKINYQGDWIKSSTALQFTSNDQLNNVTKVAYS